MKRIASALVCLAIGFVAGWTLCYHVASQKMKAAIPQGCRQFLEEYDAIFRNMTREEIREEIRKMHRYQEALEDEVDAYRLGQFSMVPDLQAAAEDNDLERVKRILSARAEEFLEGYDQGLYQPERWKERADSLAWQLRQNGPPLTAAGP